MSHHVGYTGREALRNVVAASVVVWAAAVAAGCAATVQGTADRVAERGRFEGDFAGLEPLVQPKRGSLRS